MNIQNDSGLEKEIHKMRLEPHVVPERKEVLKKTNRTPKTHVYGSSLKENRSQLTELPMAKEGII